MEQEYKCDGNPDKRRFHHAADARALPEGNWEGNRNSFDTGLNFAVYSLYYLVVNRVNP